jgi:hypothetical protein
MRFTSDISLLWLIPWAGISLLLAFWFYATTNWVKQLSNKWQLTLKLLRASSLFLIGILLVGLIFETVEKRIEKPIIISLIDESSSMKNYRDSTKIEGQISRYRKALYEKLDDSYEIVEMAVGTAVKYTNKNHFNDSYSRLSEGFDKINTDFYSRNIGGIVFVSDGNFNSGINPVYAAEKINLTPVFTLCMGDTIQKRDQYIKNVFANNVAFYKNKFPVDVDVEAVKMGKGSSTVTLSSNGKTIASQRISFENGKRDFEHITFMVDADKIGFNAYTVSVSKASNESNYANNTRTFYVEVIDSRSKVLQLSGAPHPDIASIKQELETDQNIEVESKLVSEWDKNLKKIDLVIWHEPGINFDAAIQNQLINQNIPVLYCVGPNTSASVIKKLAIGISLAGSASDQTDELQCSYNREFQQFEFSDAVKKSFEYFPPLKTKFGEMHVAGGAEILLFQRLGGITKKEPLLFFNKREQTRYGVLFGEGIWKWKMNDFVRNKNFDAFSEFVQKTTQYLLVKQNKSPLQVTFPNRFTKDEEVILNASFYNEAMQSITKPVIKLQLTDEKGKRTNFQFGVAGDFYKLSLGKMKPGKYAWIASTGFNGKSFRKTGVFIVEDVAIESLDTYSNYQVLNQIAAKTNGQFHFMKDYQKTIDAIKNRDDITSVSFDEASFNDLIDYKTLFGILLLLLSLEWFLRRWFGSY